MKRKTIWDKPTTDKDGVEITAGVEINTYTKREKLAIKNITKKQVEKIFDVNLRNREFDLEFEPRCVEICFYEKDNCFGWKEKVKTRDFWNKYKTPELLLK